jgi:quinol monooxygenase YgiN
MSISLMVALGGTLVAAAGTIVLVVRFARTPRIDLVAWAIATAGLTIALAAQVLGYRRGFADTTFRAVQIGAQLIAPLALAWGIAEVAARSLPARFVARLGVSALAVVAVVVLATDPLSSVAFNRSWPAASVHYQFIPGTLLKVIAAVAVLIALWGVITAAVRGRRDRAWKNGFAAVGVAGLAILAAEGLAVRLPANTGYPALNLLAAVLAIIASVLAGRFHPAALRAASGQADDARWGPEAHGRAGPYDADDSLGLYSGGGQRVYPDEAAGYGGASGYADYDDARYSGPDADYEGPVTGAFEGPVTGFDQPPPGRFSGPAPGGLGGPDTGGFDGPVTGAFEAPVTGQFEVPPVQGFEGPDTGSFDGPVTGMFDPLFQPNGFGGEDDTGRHGADGSRAAGDRGGSLAVQAEAADLAAEPDIEQLYGQIAIYTLLEHGAAEFDRLTDQVVEQVRVHEPDTLVYVVHGVPSAPLQRILYEVYRDRAAHDDHTSQPYIREFEIGRLPLVLATNVIELGVRQVKVSPIGSSSPRLPSSGRRSPGPLPPGVLPPAPLPPAPLPPGPRSSGSRSSGSRSSGLLPPGPLSPGSRSPGPRSSGPGSSGPGSSGLLPPGPLSPGSRSPGPRSSGPGSSGPGSSGPQPAVPRTPGVPLPGSASPGPGMPGPSASGPPPSGPPSSGPSVSGPSLPGPPPSGPSVSGPPASRPPASGPPASGPPGSGPPASRPRPAGSRSSGPRPDEPWPDGPWPSGSEPPGPRPSDLPYDAAPDGRNGRPPGRRGRRDQ